MKVTIVDKGEGFLLARFDAENASEAIMCSTCALAASRLSINLKSYVSPTGTQYDNVQLVFEGFSIPTHEVLQTKKK